MKTLSVTLTLAIFLLTTSVYSKGGQSDSDTKAKMSLELAIQNPDLVQQMYIQLDDGFLCTENTSAVHSAEVIHQGTQYIITGTIEEWTLFFLMDL